MLLGSYQAYMREFQAVPGTYYLSKGWLESGSHPLKEYEEYVPKYGAEEAMWLMDQQYQHYERLVLVAHNQADLEAYRPQAQEVARFCERWGMRYEEILGSDRYVRRLVELVERAAKALDALADVNRTFWSFHPAARSARSNSCADRLRSKAEAKAPGWDRQLSPQSLTSAH